MSHEVVSAVVLKRKFDPQVIVTCVRWYLRFCLSLRDLEELMAERDRAIDYTSIWRWISCTAEGVRGHCRQYAHRYANIESRSPPN